MVSSNAPKPALPGIKQFRHEGCYSYLLFDAASGESVLIDPRADLLDDYREYISERKLKPVAVVDTRLHWHHLSGSHFIADAYGVPVAMSERTASKRATRKLEHGAKLKAGCWELTALATPGVCPDAISLYGAGLLFCGDTLAIGNGARTDLPGGDPKALWDSLHSVLGKLPPRTIVLPGHDHQDLLFSTLEVEKKRGSDWQPASREALAQAKSEERPPRGDGDVKRRLEYNLSAAPEDSPESHFGGAMPVSSAAVEARGVAAISVEKLALKIKEGAPDVCVVDVREPEEHAAVRIPGALHFPLSELALHLDELFARPRLYFLCHSGRRSEQATRTFDYLGFPDAVNVSGGMRAWMNAGLAVDQ